MANTVNSAGTNAAGINSSNFMYAGTTPGGYPVRNPGAINNPNRTGLWRSVKVPFAPQPITPKEMRQGSKNAEYTYRGYAVPNFAGSDLIGMPANSYLMINGQSQGKNWDALQNTKTELNKIAGWGTEDLKKLQNALIQNGWLGKNESTGRPTQKTLAAVAFLMDQGNQIGENWENVMQLGPKGLRQMGGQDISGGGGPRTTTSTASAVDYSTKAQARNYLRQALADVLGRGPQAGEVDEFLDMLRSKEAKNPTVTTTVTTSGDGSSSSESSQEGGFDEQEATDLAMNFAREQNPKQAKRYARAGYEQMLDALIMGG